MSMHWRTADACLFLWHIGPWYTNKVTASQSWFWLIVTYDLYLWRFDLKVPDWYQLPKAQVQVQVLRSEVEVQVPVIPDQVQPKYSSMDSGW